MRARVAVGFIEDDKEAVAQFRQRRAQGGRQAVASQYGLILALTRNLYKYSTAVNSGQWQNAGRVAQAV